MYFQFGLLNQLRSFMVLIQKSKVFMKEKSNCKLKVYSKHRSNEIKPVPEIRLTGKWMEALSFQVGDAFHIRKQADKLIPGEKSLTNQIHRP